MKKWDFPGCWVVVYYPSRQRIRQGTASSFGEGIIKSPIFDRMRSVQNIKVDFQ